MQRFHYALLSNCSLVTPSDSEVIFNCQIIDNAFVNPCYIQSSTGYAVS